MPKIYKESDMKASQCLWGFSVGFTGLIELGDLVVGCGNYTRS